VFFHSNLFKNDKTLKFSYKLPESKTINFNYLTDNNYNINKFEAKTMDKLIYRAESFQIIGACLEVYNELGPGFLESVYQEALHREFILRGIPHQQQYPLEVFYKEDPLNRQFRADFLCYDKILVELKATSSLTSIDEAVVLNYLKASRLHLAILVNFCEAELVFKRLIETRWG
jgi:GxxExxY protein